GGRQVSPRRPGRHRPGQSPSLALPRAGRLRRGPFDHARTRSRTPPRARPATRTDVSGPPGCRAESSSLTVSNLDVAMDAHALRRVFTQFFVDRGHTAVSSAGLIPHDPRAPLFTNAGMNQFIPYFLGDERPRF